MNAYTVLLIMIVYRIEARSNEIWPNVGSVLFTREDLKKPIWSKSDVALLTARRHFQKLIPPPSFISVENEFVDKMLAYFRDTYTAIKSVSPDHEVDRIMTTALSDTVGGYLKLCVLPVTKLSFYGGIASYDSAYKVFKFYSEIKKYLCTDGQNWRSPDQKMLNAIVLNVPTVVRQKKHMPNTHDSARHKDPCTSFNYFEKSPRGLVVPMPVVNWDDVSMFLPVLNESTFSLHSPKHCNTLENYYNKAKTCMNSKSEAVAADFDAKFQHWLSSDILPHLKDDRLYVALGNVLALLNRTREMCDVILDIYNTSSKDAPPTYKTVLCSKTTIVVIIILIFEIIWCIVAIDRLCFKKPTDFDDYDDNSNRVISYFRTCSENGLMQFKNRHTKQFEITHAEMATSTPSFMQKWSTRSNYTQMDRNINYVPKSAEIGCQKELPIIYDCSSMGIGSRSLSQSSFRYQVHSSDVFTIVNERIKDFSSPPPLPVKITNRSYTKLPSNICGVKGCDARDSCTCLNSIHLYNSPSNTVARTKNKSAITIFTSQKSLEGGQAFYRTDRGKDFHIEKTTSECKRNETVVELGSCSMTPTSCICQNCGHDSKVSVELEKIPSVKEVATDSLICYCSKEKPTTVTRKAKTISAMEMMIMRVDKETETKAQKKKSFVNKLTSSAAVNMPKEKKNKQSQRKRYLEIKIDRPKAAIKLGISNKQESPRKGQSKIPTRKSVLHAQGSTRKRPVAITSILPEYVDKSVNSVIQCIEKSTDYTLTQEYTTYQVSAEDKRHVVNKTPQNRIKNHSAPESTLLSIQDVTTVSKCTNTYNQSISQQDKSAETKLDKQDLNLMTVKRSESDLSKLSRYTADILVPCTNLKQNTQIGNRNDGSSIEQEISKMTDKERLIHTIYEHSTEALLSALATEEEKIVKEQIFRESGKTVIESNDVSETEKKGSYILSKYQSLEQTKLNINQEISIMPKRQKSMEPIKKIFQRERTTETVKTKIPKRNIGTPFIIPRPETSLIKWKTSMELEQEQNCEPNDKLVPNTENVKETSSIVLKKSDTYGDTTCKRQEEDGDNGQTNSLAMRKSKIPQLMRIDDAHRAKTLKTKVRLNLSF